MGKQCDSIHMLGCDGQILATKAGEIITLSIAHGSAMCELAFKWPDKSIEPLQEQILSSPAFCSCSLSKKKRKCARCARQMRFELFQITNGASQPLNAPSSSTITISTPFLPPPPTFLHLSFPHPSLIFCFLHLLRRSFPFCFAWNTLVHHWSQLPVNTIRSNSRHDG